MYAADKIDLSDAALRKLLANPRPAKCDDVVPPVELFQDNRAVEELRAVIKRFLKAREHELAHPNEKKIVADLYHRVETEDLSDRAYQASCAMLDDLDPDWLRFQWKWQAVYDLKYFWGENNKLTDHSGLTGLPGRPNYTDGNATACNAFVQAALEHIGEFVSPRNIRAWYEQSYRRFGLPTARRKAPAIS